MLGRDHSKVSAKLRQMVSDDASAYTIERAIPNWYYPRLDDSNGRNFVAFYLRNYEDTDLIDTFIARGMDLNVAVNADGDTLLHVLLENSYTWDSVVSELLDNFSEIDVTIENEQGQRPLDSYLLHRGGQGRGRFVYKLLMRELDSLYPEGASPARTDYLRARMVEVIGHLDGQELARLIPAQLPIDLRLPDGRTLFMAMVQNANVHAVQNIINRAGFVLPAASERVVETMLTRFGAQAAGVVKTLCAEHKAVVTREALDKAIDLKDIDLLTFLYPRVKPQGDPHLTGKLFARVLAAKNVQYALEAAQHAFFAEVADIDAPLDEQGTTLLLDAIARGRTDDARKLLEAGADIRKIDGTGRIAREHAEESRNKQTIALVEQTLRSLNQRGNFERVHKTQISCKNGMLTYIFDFYAGQVVVRDNETKHIAATSFAEFAKSGGEMLSDAARHLTALGGDAKGFGSENSLSPAVARKAASPIRKPSN